MLANFRWLSKTTAYFPRLKIVKDVINEKTIRYECKRISGKIFVVIINKAIILFM